MVFDEVISPWRDMACKALHMEVGSVVIANTRPQVRDLIKGRKTGELELLSVKQS